MLRPWLRGQLENFFEVFERSLRFAIRIDHVAQFLQRAKDEERIDEQREELPDGDALREDQVQHQEHDGGAQQVDAGALYETQTAQVAHLFEFELEDLVGGAIQPVDLLLRQAQAFHQFNIAQRFGGGARQGGRLADDALLDNFNLAAQDRT